MARRTAARGKAKCYWKLHRQCDAKRAGIGSNPPMPPAAAGTQPSAIADGVRHRMRIRNQLDTCTTSPLVQAAALLLQSNSLRPTGRRASKPRIFNGITCSSASVLASSRCGEHRSARAPSAEHGSQAPKSHPDLPAARRRRRDRAHFPRAAVSRSPRSPRSCPSAKISSPRSPATAKSSRFLPS